MQTLVKQSVNYLNNINNMSKAIRFLEKTTVFTTDQFGETSEDVNINDAITACQIQELETLQWVMRDSLNSPIEHDTSSIELKITELIKKLKFIK